MNSGPGVVGVNGTQSPGESLPTPALLVYNAACPQAQDSPIHEVFLQ